MKAIDHHPVETGEDLDLAGRLLRQLAKPAGLADAAEHEADELTRVHVRLDHARLGFYHDVGAGEMDGDVEALACVLQLHPEHALDRVGAGEIIDAGANRLDRAFREHLRDRTLHELGMLEAEKRRYVLGRDADREVGEQREQESERLHAAGNVDRLAVAVGEIDLLIHARPDRSPDCAESGLVPAIASANRSNARRAPSTAPISSLIVSAWRSSRARKLCQRCRPAPWLR